MDEQDCPCDKGCPCRSAETPKARKLYMWTRGSVQDFLTFAALVSYVSDLI